MARRTVRRFFQGFQLTPQDFQRPIRAPGDGGTVALEFSAEVPLSGQPGARKRAAQFVWIKWLNNGGKVVFV